MDRNVLVEVCSEVALKQGIDVAWGIQALACAFHKLTSIGGKATANDILESVKAELGTFGVQQAGLLAQDFTRQPKV